MSKPTQLQMEIMAIRQALEGQAMSKPTQAQIEAILAEFEEELTSQQRKLIAHQIASLIAAAALTPDKRREE